MLRWIIVCLVLFFVGVVYIFVLIGFLVFFEIFILFVMMIGLFLGFVILECNGLIMEIFDILDFYLGMIGWLCGVFNKLFKCINYLFFFCVIVGFVVCYMIGFVLVVVVMVVGGNL